MRAQEIHALITAVHWILLAWQLAGCVPVQSGAPPCLHVREVGTQLGRMQTLVKCTRIAACTPNCVASFPLQDLRDTLHLHDAMQQGHT